MSGVVLPLRAGSERTRGNKPDPVPMQSFRRGGLEGTVPFFCNPHLSDAHSKTPRDLHGAGSNRRILENAKSLQRIEHSVNSVCPTPLTGNESLWKSLKAGLSYQSPVEFCMADPTDRCWCHCLFSGMSIEQAYRLGIGGLSPALALHPW